MNDITFQEREEIEGKKVNFNRYEACFAAQIHIYTVYIYRMTDMGQGVNLKPHIFQSEPKCA